MMSIDLIKWLSLSQDKFIVMTYFFCQNANYELNILEAIIKSLILQLVNQQQKLKESLQRCWDTKNARFSENVTSWQTLWDIFLEMLKYCKCQRVYVIVNALDECQDDDMIDFLKRLVRTKLHHSSKIKWLLTSRSLNSAERELLAESDQVLVSLKLNSNHVSETVKTYIAFKANELDRRNAYELTLQRNIQTELINKAKNTYLWVSLICKRLERVHREKTLTTIQDLSSDLHSLYNRVFHQLRSDHSVMMKKCMRLLKAILLVYRPLNIAEVSYMSGLSEEWNAIKALVDRCASFLKMREIDIEFVHQSAQDYLVEKISQFIFNFYKCYEHDEIALSCLSYLSQRLKINLIDLSRSDSTRELMKRNTLISSIDYTVFFWMQHLDDAQQISLIQNALAEQEKVSTFLHTKLLKWVECLSLLNKLSRVFKTLNTLTDMTDVSDIYSISRIID